MLEATSSLRTGLSASASSSTAVPTLLTDVSSAISYIDCHTLPRAPSNLRRQIVERALEGVDSVVHLAARVGVGQSMYEIAEYTSVNSVGTAVLLEALAEKPVRKLLVASSMSVYGEGLYRAGDGSAAEPAERTREQ